MCTFKLIEFIIMSNGDEKMFSCRDLCHYANPYLPKNFPTFPELFPYGYT